MRKAPTLRWNNGSIQMRVRVDGVDQRLHRLGRWDDPRAVARAQAISAQIWSDFQAGELDPTLQKYQVSSGLEDVNLLKALKVLVDRQPYGRVAHGYRTVERYGHPIRSAVEVGAFVAWMEAEGLSASTRQSIVGLLRRVQPQNAALQAVQIKVPARSVQHEVLSTVEIQKVLQDLQEREQWFFVCFALWMSTGLRNSELIGLTWDAVHLQDGELVISKTLRRDGNSNHRRVWSGTKTGRSRVVPLAEHLVLLLEQHRSAMGELNLDVEQGLVFVTPRSYGNLYDGLLERVWKRSQRRVGLVPRRLYAIRHSFLSHALALGNSPADLASMAGHRTEELLKTYAKPTGRLKLPCWG
jgi:integrase